MGFSNREKVIIAATVAALGFLVLFYGLTRLLNERAAVQDNEARLVAQMARARSLFRRRRLLEPRWQRMLAGGMRRDPTEAESQLLRSLRDWSAAEGVKLSSLRPERSAEKSELPEITVHAAGSGSMASVSGLLRRIETAQIPVKIRMLQLGSRKDGTDDLSLHLRVSTLYSPLAGPASTERAAGSGKAGGGDR